MKTSLGSLLLVISFAACAAAQPSDLRSPEPPPLLQLPQAGDNGAQRLTMPFSDPAKPGKVEVSLVNGSITILPDGSATITEGGPDTE